MNNIKEIIIVLKTFWPIVYGKIDLPKDFFLDYKYSKEAVALNMMYILLYCFVFSSDEQ